MRELLKNRQIAISVAILAFLVFIAVFADVLAPYDYTEKNLQDRLQPPSFEHLFGTDQLGRDILTMVMYGARASLFVGFTVTFVSMMIGVSIGIFAGYYGGWADEVLMRLTDSFLAFPSMFLALGITAFLGQGLENMMIALIIVEWTVFARVARGSTLDIRTKGYIRASQWVGASDGYIIARHILPNIVTPVLIMATLGIGNVILAAAGLSFLGLGVQPSTPEWGAMLNAGRSYFSSAPYMMFFPGFMIMITVLAFNYFGDGLRDVLDRHMTATELEGRIS
ncbi:binding-protein-dependent transport systems inner membrane component [Methanolacinia petrolearia DSM 11571]|uniref:Binding-protein-dependent transport systems inner membrane component n=1 Tax=Methanolacinia petrolearia (strain DSM 11571 / OCM 486 / SEBR 4847) TaxID=679926 RepID=E1RJK7_METP4|nr:nickel transporter permease [Methanolacinia petrolearia]ADN35654.1 binding-protein-dependent transport systems inner membrane component [Methanolacinia petrolearia DSM 11571]